MLSRHHVKPDHTVKYLDQQEDVPLGYKGGQDRCRGYRRISICIRQPAMKRKQGTLDRQPDRHQPQGHQQRNMVIPLAYNKVHLFLDIAHQELSRNPVQEADAQQQHTGAEQAHNHIPRRRHDRPAILPDHDQSTGGNRIDLHKYISGEQVVRIDQRQQRTEQKVYHHIVKILLALLDSPLPAPGSRPAYTGTSPRRKKAAMNASRIPTRISFPQGAVKWPIV